MGRRVRLDDGDDSGLVSGEFRRGSRAGFQIALPIEEHPIHDWIFDLRFSCSLRFFGLSGYWYSTTPLRRYRRGGADQRPIRQGS